jgi:hypothetical protein
MTVVSTAALLPSRGDYVKHIHYTSDTATSQLRVRGQHSARALRVDVDRSAAHD